MFEHVVAGLLGGLLASAIVVAFTKWWQKVFFPWLEDLLYKGPRVDGIWRAVIKRETDYLEQVELEQSGYRITGTQVYPQDRYGRSHKYSLEGEFREQTLSLIFHELGPTATDSGAIVLDYKTIGPKLTLQGYGVWRDRAGALVVEKYEWTKESERLISGEEEPLLPVV